MVNFYLKQANYVQQTKQSKHSQWNLDNKKKIFLGSFYCLRGNKINEFDLGFTSQPDFQRSGDLIILKKKFRRHKSSIIERE